MTKAVKRRVAIKVAVAYSAALSGALAQIDEDKTLPHIGLVGDTYTITVTGAETAGRFCVIDMHIPPGGGPPLHRLEIIYAERSSASRATLSLDSHCGYSDLLFFRPPRFVSKQ
jgi:hypothetical protein